MSGLRLEMKAGDSATFDIKVREADGVTPTDLTGATIQWVVAPVLAAGQHQYASLILSKSLGTGISVPVAGTLRISVGAGEMPAGRFVHECKVTFPGGSRETVAHGGLISYPSI